MGKEIERKFLVTGSGFKVAATERHDIIQTYLNCDPEATVRLRLYDNAGFFTIKSRNNGAERGEWEYPIPQQDVEEIIRCCHTSASISKTRWIIPTSGGLRWEIDEFHGSLSPLIVAEIELPSADTPLPMPLPDFIGEEVTGNPDYYNSSLAAKTA